MARVNIGTCTGPAEAALVRSAFAAHDIHVVINAEQHASMLGGLGGAFLAQHIYVDEDDAEEAAELLRDLRAKQAADEPEDEAEDEHDAGASSVEVRVARRKGTGVVLLLGLCVTFGTAHMYTGAWGRGLLLAGAEILSFKYLAAGSKVGTALLVGAIVVDLVGALSRVRARKPPIPQARVRR